MPTYEYGCEACGHEFEREQRITEDPIKKCPKCGKNQAKRLITQGNFILKGGGWYADLYHKGAPPKSSVGSNSSGSKSENSSDSGTAPKSDTSTSDSKPTDSKPAKKDKKTTAK